MKNRCLPIFIMTFFLVYVVVGCGREVNNTASAAAETENPTEDLSFADLSRREFHFSWESGGWSESFIIEKDGYFRGLYNGVDMAATGEGYESGTMYSSSYSGHFTDLTKINAYTYKMKLADLSYKEEPDTIEFSDELGEHYRYMYTTSSCLNKADTYTIYLPGTPVSELSEEVAEWLKTGAVNDSESELVVIIIADEANGYGIYSTDRPEPLEEAGRCYSGAVSSCDYYTEKISEATTTLEWLELNAICYSIMDDCLNEIWHLIKYNVEEETYKQLLVQQQAWISQKEEEANKAAEEWEGGSFASVAHMEKLFTLTQERCEELLPYLE